MSHLVETMAWTNEVPWHGLGKQVDDDLSPEQMLKAAGIDWSVSLRPMRYSVKSLDDTRARDYTQDVGTHRALVRDSDNRVLDVVGRGYIPVQNADAFKFFTEFVHAGKAKMDTAGSLRGGRLVWGLASLQKSFKLRGGDEVSGYLLLASPHEQGRSMVGKLTAVRVVCNNTLTLAMSQGGNEFRFRHVREFDEKAMDKAKDTLGIARDSFEQWHDNVVLMTKRRVAPVEARRILADHFSPGWAQHTDIPPIPEKVFEDDKAMSKVLKLPARQAITALEYAPGHDLVTCMPAKGTFTAWAVLNAATYTCDHLMRRDPDRRVYNAWFGNTNRIKRKVFEEALEISQ